MKKSKMLIITTIIIIMMLIQIILGLCNVSYAAGYNYSNWKSEYQDGPRNHEWDIDDGFGKKYSMFANWTCMYFNNIYCIQKGYHHGDDAFFIYYGIKIRGNTATLYKKNWNTEIISWESTNNNIMAGIISNAANTSEGARSSGDYKTGTPSGTQYAIWQFWGTFENDMAKALKAEGKWLYNYCENDGSSKTRKFGLSNSYSSEGGRVINIVKNKIEEDNIAYNADIVIMDASKNKASDGTKRQNLIGVRSHTPGRLLPITKFTVQKEWDDLDNKFGTRPSEINVTLYCDDGEEDKIVTTDYFGNKIVNPITLSSANASSSNLWIYTFENLIKEKNDNRRYYVVESASTTKAEDEEKYAEYKEKGAAITKGYKFTNKIETIDIPITKQWEDFGNKYSNRPKSISVSLYKGDEKIETKKITGEKTATTWTTTFTNLRKFEKGQEIQYTVREDDDLTGYTTNITGDMTGYTITNTLNTIDIEFKKIWEDSYNGIDNFDEIRPANIKIQLQNQIGTAKFVNASGMKNSAYNSAITFTPKDSSSNTWTYKFENLPVYREGKITEYKIVETAITDYKQKEGYVEATKDNDYTIINVHEPYYAGYIEIRGIAWLDGNPGKGSEINGTYGKEDKGLSGVKVSLKKGTTAIKATYTDENGEFTRTDYAITDSEGKYTIKVNYDNSKNVYDLYTSLTDLANNLRTAHVEFEYDGMLYTTVAPKIDIFDQNENTSKVVEDSTRRNTIDKNNTTVEYKTAHPDNVKWDNKKITAKTNTVMPFSGFETVLEYYNKDNSNNMSFEEFINSLDTNKTYKDAFKKDFEAAKKINSNLITNEDDFKNYIIEKVKHEVATEKVKYINTESKKTQKTNYKTAWTDPKTTNKTASDTVDKEYEVNVAVIENVNIGLFKREQPDVAVDIDISEVQLTMNGTDYIYTKVVDLNADTSDEYREAYDDAINNKGMSKEEAKEYAIQVVGEKAYEEAYYDAINNRGMEEEEAKEYAKKVEVDVKFQNKYTYTYRRAVNPNDITYTGTGTNTTSELEVYVTYEVKVENRSSTLPITVSSIVNYFDSNYTLDTKSSSKGWSNKADVSGETRYDKTTYSTPITVAASSESEPIKLKYKVNLPEKVTSKEKITIQEKIQNWLESEYPLNNAVEIAKYSTKYGENTLYAEQRTGDKVDSKGVALPYAGYDYNSHPGNLIPEKRIVINNVDGQDRIEIKDGEDDEDIAPPFILELPQPVIVEKQLTGIVYEDTDIDESNDERIGNGKYDANEVGIDNVKVELYNIDGTRANIYRYDQDGNILSATDAVTYTKDGGKYGFAGVEKGEYFIKFTYGNDTRDETTTTYYKRVEDAEGNIIDIQENTEKELPNGATKMEYPTNDTVVINARNYKSTTIEDSKIIDSDTGSTLKTLLKKEYTEYTEKEKQWPVTHTEGYSVAVDNMLDRLDIEDLKNDNYNFGDNMTAYTKPFYIETEVIIASGEEQTVPPIEFNFGIIERPREALLVEKTITDFSLTLQNGTALVSGNPSVQNASFPYTKTLGLRTLETSTNNFERMTTTDCIKAAKNALEKKLIVEIDNELVQNSQLEITYDVIVTNKNEVDYDYGTNDNYNNEIEKNVTLDVCDKYISTNALADYYYYGEVSNELRDREMIATIQLIDYLDKDLIYVEREDQENKWRSVDINTLYSNGEISRAVKDNNIGNEYNIFRTYQDEINIVRGGSFSQKMSAKKLLSNHYAFDNSAEIIKIDGKTARTVKAKYLENGALTQLSYIPGNHIATQSAEETDTGKVNLIITLPTGLLNNIIIYIITILAGVIIMFGGIIIIKKKVLIK